MRGIRWILAVVAIAALLTGCGDDGSAGTTAKRPDQPQRPEPQKKNLKSVEITLDSAPNAENVGVVMAQHSGYFEDAGLEVSMHTPASPLLPVKYVAERTVDLSVTSQPQLAIAKEKGIPLVAVRSLIPKPTAAMIWLRKSKIGDLSDLEGKTIAIPGLPFQEDLLASVLAEAGLTLADVKVEKVEYLLVQALASGRADAIFGGSWNIEGVELDLRGLEPVITRVENLDIPPYEELVIVVRRDRLAKDPSSIRAFLEAVARGTAAAIEDPEAAAEAIIEETAATNRKAIEAQVEATLPLLSRTGRLGTGG